jgi:mannose-1-phosphate guanylyltransferase
VEKPTVERAAELLATGLASWNAGIFAWTRATIRDRLQRHSSDIVGLVAQIVANGTHEEMERAYPSIRATSIDYAVMEPASLEGAVAVVPMSVGWSDLGSWSALRDAWQEAVTDPAGGATVGLGNRRDIGSTDSLVLAEGRLVVTIGLHDVIVVDTPEALLVCSAERSQEVRTIAQEFPNLSRTATKEEE